MTSWDEIFTSWQKSQYSKTIDGLQEFLEKNYKSPIKINEFIHIKVLGGVAYCDDLRVKIIDYD